MLSKFGVAFLILFLILTATAFGQEWHTANQITISWDAVTEMQGGIAIPEADIIEYKIYLANAVTDLDKANPIEIGITGDISYVITLVDEGQYFVGLQTIRKVSSTEVVITKSVIGWTDDPAICSDGNTFGVRYFLSPMMATGIRINN